jgi:D-arginine dehydrogenase
MDKQSDVDFIVAGAGMAGASVAAHLSPFGTVAILEAEAHPGYHSTGRSAATYSELYGNPVIRALTRASRAFLFSPPQDFAPVPLVHQRETVYFARADQASTLERWRSQPDIRAATTDLDAEAAQARLPVFAPGYLGGAILEHGSADIDVDALHQGFLRAARKAGAQLHCDARITALERRDGKWIAATPAGTFSAPVLVNAAGAWGDELAVRAGVLPIGLQPMRRTAVLIETPSGLDASQWPMAIDIDEQFYFKPDAGLLLLSPADENPSPPCDAQPEELDIAIAIDRFEQATGAAVRKLRQQWAGLRVFAPDRSPVVGFDDGAAGFFWLVGQGGYGIQTAAALGRVAATLARGMPLDEGDTAMGIDAALLSPQRLRGRA